METEQLKRIADSISEDLRISKKRFGKTEKIFRKRENLNLNL